jgi:hypothetical protein
VTIADSNKAKMFWLEAFKIGGKNAVFEKLN